MPVARPLGSGTDLGRRCERPLDYLADRLFDRFRPGTRARCIDDRARRYRRRESVVHCDLFLF
jgi:hypothetical protein